MPVGIEIILQILGGMAALVVILDYFGVKLKGLGSLKVMPLNRMAKLVVMLGLVALSLVFSGYSAYRSFRPKVIEKEKLVDHPIQKVVEKPVPCRTPSEKKHPSISQVSPVQTSGPQVVNSAPYGIAISGGSVDHPTVNNFSTPIRHLTAAQVTAISELADSLPDTASKWLSIQTENDSDSEAYGQEIGKIFTDRGKAKEVLDRLVADNPLPQGVYVGAFQDSPNFDWAQKIANSLFNLGILRKDGFQAPREMKQHDEVLILVGVRQ